MPSAHRMLQDLFRAPYAMLDPGDAGTITVDRQMAVVPIVTAAAETRTLAQPTKAGLICTLQLDVYVGAATVTVTGGYEPGGSTSISMDTAGDWIAFHSVKVGTSFYWRVLAAQGVLTSPTRKYLMTGGGKVGTTAGWAVPADNMGHYTMAASQTAGTLVIPVTGLPIGAKITGFKVIGQIESAGNTATLDADLRKLTGAAAALVDASVGAITQISKTADYAIIDEKTGLEEVIAEGESFYVLLTGTTAASTDIDLQGVIVYTTE